MIGSYQSKTNLALLSYNGKTMSIHTNTYSNDLFTFNEENKQQNIDTNYSDNIYDIQKITSTLTIDDLSKFIFQKLKLNKDYLKEEVKYDQRYFIDSQEDYDNTYKNSKDPFEIIKIAKLLKLTKTQMKLLKSAINYSNDKLVTISKYYGVSLSKLSRIINMK